MDTKKLREIRVSAFDDKVSISLVYSEGPANHVVLPVSTARDLAAKIENCIRNPIQADQTGVTDMASLSIGKPKETLQ